MQPKYTKQNIFGNQSPLNKYMLNTSFYLAFA